MFSHTKEGDMEGAMQMEASSWLDDMAFLKTHADNLQPYDRKFAYSLITQFNTGQTTGKSLSEKQQVWVTKLAQKAVQPPAPPEREKLPVGDLSGILGLFDEARKHLKFPAIVLAYKDAADHLQELRLTIAGASAKVPGSINVVNVITKFWYGRVLKSGELECSPRWEDDKQPIQSLLQKFASHPAETAAEHGHLTGKCCFCNGGLSDERSTSVGYGPVCAKHYGLPWGHK